MIPENIKIKYQGFDNPFRKIFFNEKDYAACDFSDLIPSWKLEFSKDCPDTLIEEAINYAEDRGYYSFYIMISEESLDKSIDFFKQWNYLLYVEEVVLKNEKSINQLFWEWIFDTTNQPEDVVIVKCMLSQECR
jgi:hypothetical protein